MAVAAGAFIAAGAAGDIRRRRLLPAREEDAVVVGAAKDTAAPRGTLIVAVPATRTLPVGSSRAGMALLTFPLPTEEAAPPACRAAAAAATLASGTSSTQ